jgi:cysteine synthase A
MLLSGRQTGRLPPMLRPILVDDLLGLIGNTPLTQLQKACGSPRTHAAVWGKCEMMNPGGSVKDRIALAMVEAGEADGTLHPGETVIVEPTSGNTGIGLALVCAVKGYRLVLTMPESMSLERRKLLKAYGAEILLTPDDRTMEGAVTMAGDMCRQPNHVMLQQFENPANPGIHRQTTGPEILKQLDGLKVDGFVSAVGTGGTISGIGEVFREHNPQVRIVAVEPARSPVLTGGEPGPHKIQGIGAGFIPKVLNTEIYDSVETVWDEDAWRMKQRLSREEGLLVGISSGAAVLAASRLAEELGPGKNVVTILCDTGERYFSLDEYFTGEPRK